MNMPLLTIIIPTHNSERYILKLLQCLKNQSYKNFKIIIIDDCSNDNTVNIIKNYKDSLGVTVNFVPLLENHGASYCRNLGIMSATTPFITFIDSDDWIDIEALSNCMQFLDNDSDVIIYGLSFDKVNINECQKVYIYPRKITIDGEYALKIYGQTIHDELQIAPNVFNKIYKLDFVQKNELFFDEETRYQEDDVFTFKILMHARTVTFVPAYFYHYSQNQNSVIHEVSDVSINHFIKAYKGLLEYLKRGGLFEKYRDEFYLRFKTSLNGVISRTVEYAKSNIACSLLASLYKQLLENFDIEEFFAYCDFKKAYYC